MYPSSQRWEVLDHPDSVLLLSVQCEFDAVELQPLESPRLRLPLSLHTFSLVVTQPLLSISSIGLCLSDRLYELVVSCTIFNVPLHLLAAFNESRQTLDCQRETVRIQ